MAFPNSSYASWNYVPDQTINISVKYDQSSQQFYGLSASGSDLIEVSIIDGNTIKIHHGRDGYKGVRVPAGTSHRFARNTALETRTHALVGNSTNGTIVVDVGRGNSKIMGLPTTSAGRNFDGIGCRTTDTWTAQFTSYQVYNTKTNSIYSGDWCLGQNATLSQYGDFIFPSDGGQIGYVERYFKFPMDIVNKIALDEYVGIYQSAPTADVIRNGNFDLGRELYRYVISVNIKPSINSFLVDHENLIFAVNKQSTQIVGKAQTGFNIQGAFLNSQAFDLTLTSSNNALCSGELCLVNSAASTTIPYTAKVFDPSTLLEKRISRSGQKITIYSDKDYHLSGGLLFEFDTENTALSGGFNDILTVRVELKLI